MQRFLLYSFVFLLTTQASVCDTKRPNIIFIMGDDHGWNDVGFHGGLVKTPNIDNLAKSGVILDNYYVGPNCGPSRAQFLTGKYVTHLGLQHKNLVSCRPSGIPLSERTIADELKDLNYTTHMIGKWHSGFYTSDHLPQNRGFDSFFGMLNGMSDHYHHTSNYRGQPYLDLYNGTKPVTEATGIYSTDLYKNRALELIDRHNTTGDPMFMYLSFQAPHTPLQAPPIYKRRYNWIDFRDRQIYAAMVTAMDAAIGEIINRLKENGMYENTVVVYSTDNGGQSIAGSGGASNYPLRGNKATYYEAGIRALGVVHSPLLNVTGVSRALFHVTDWKPTLIQLAGGYVPAGLDGHSQWDILVNGKDSSRKVIIYNIDPLSEVVDESETPDPIDDIFEFDHIDDINETKGGSFQPASGSNYRQLLDYKEKLMDLLRLRFTKLKNRRARDFNVRQLAAIRYENWKLLTGDHGFNRLVPNPDKNLKAFRRTPKTPLPAPLIQLFDVENDPTESTNLADERQDIVQMLLDKLAEHQMTAVEPFYPPVTNKCDPALNGGVWGPYLDS